LDKKEPKGVAGVLDLTNRQLNELVLEEVEKLLISEGYDVAKMYINKSAGSEVRNSLQRIIATCQNCNISPVITAEILKSLLSPKKD
jgi:hypothetical protein